ncbi:MAG: RdgB/HAM1 family non-canonical purine NTP pyrophosphatase [Armatimonadetes bacterium]|nr:RdgB/HAM1 family non-canonical purine NTP pyrophosphatase [Armatimonadota bacterium]
MDSNRLVIATHNAKKAGEMVKILSEHFPELEIVTLADYPGAPEPEETGTTYKENAIIKVESAAEFTGEWCVADDAGLEIDAIPEELGVWSKRFAGEDTPFGEKMRLVLEKLDGLPDEKRSARFNCWVALAKPGYATQTFQGVCEGRIAYEQTGTGGFGYDPIFFLPELGCTMAQLTPEEKAAISHRGKVLKLLSDHLAASGW